LDQEGTHDISALFDRHFDAVYSYVAYRVAPDREAARDITQEVFLAAVRGLPAGLSQGSTVAWLKSVARIKTADYFRMRRDDPVMSADACEAGEQPAAPVAEELATLVSVVMRRLPYHYADLLEYKYMEGLSTREIADRTGSSEKAVESALSRARGTFRQTFEKLRSEQETSP
jgi:RNA polymerase sigma-70 factor (ECF subfamily)